MKHGRKGKFSKSLSIAISALMITSLALALFVAVAPQVAGTGMTNNNAPATTVAPGTANVLIMDFTITDGGDSFVAGAEPIPGTSVTVANGADADWSIDSYDAIDGDAWNSEVDYLGIDDDADSVYTAQADTILDGTGPGAGTTLMTTNPWTTGALIAFVDGGTTNLWESANDLILQDDDKDAIYTSSADIFIDSNGTTDGTAGTQDTTTAGTTLVQFHATNDSDVYYLDDDGTAGLSSGDTLFHDTATVDGDYDAGELIIGTAPVAGTVYTGTIAGSNFAHAETGATSDTYDEGEDIFWEETAGAGTYSAAADSILAGTGTAPSAGTALNITNPFTTAPQVAFYDGGAAGTYESGSDVIVADPHNGGTYSAAADIDVAGTAPSDGTSYTVLDAFDTDWTLDSIDDTDGDSWNAGADAIIIDADTNNVYRDTFTAMSIHNTATSPVTDTEVSAIKVWKEEGTTPGFQSAEDTEITAATVSWDGSEWDITGLAQDITVDTRFYVTMDVAPQLTSDYNMKAETTSMTTAGSETLSVANAYTQSIDGLPAVTSMETVDSNGNGVIDQIKVVYDEDVVNVGTDDLTIDGSAPSGATEGPAGTVTYDIANPGTTPNTDATPAIVFSTANIQDTFGNDLASGQDGNAVDKAAPVVVEAVTGDADADGQIDYYKLTFSEVVDEATLTNSDNNGFDVIDYEGEVLCEVLPADSTFDLTDQKIYYLVFTESGTADTGVVPGVTYTDTDIFDTATPANEFMSGAVNADIYATETDKASPIVIEFEAQIGAKTATVKFSEGIENSTHGSIGTSELLYTDVGPTTAISDVSHIAGGNQATIVLTAQVQKTGDIGADKINLEATAYDLVGNPAATTTATMADVRNALSLVDGWNLVSVPKVPSADWKIWDSIEDVTVIYIYDEGHWHSITTENNVKSLDGVALKANGPQELALSWTTSAQAVPPTEELEVGWNLIGPNMDPNVEIAVLGSELLYTIDGSYSTVFSPNFNLNNWSAVPPVAQDMLPYEGYWIFMEASDTLAGRTT